MSTSDEVRTSLDRRDGQPVVRLEDVEVADGVAEVVPEAVDANAARLGLEPERDAALAAGLERLQAQLGRRLDDRGACS